MTTQEISRPTRGLKNRNPGNLRHTGIPWEGLAGSDDKGFCIFKDDAHGIRAIVKDLRKDYFKDGQRTITELIAEYAPPNENDTKAYIAFVARRLGVAPDQDIAFNATSATALVEAIIKMENGVQPYPPEVIAAGVTLALV